MCVPGMAGQWTRGRADRWRCATPNHVAPPLSLRLQPDDGRTRGRSLLSSNLPLHQLFQAPSPRFFLRAALTLASAAAASPRAFLCCAAHSALLLQLSSAMASAVSVSSSVAASVAAPSTSKVVTNAGIARSTFLCGRRLRMTQVAAAATGDLTVSAGGDRPLWLPGSTPPAWLDGTLPGDYGFDPLDLAAEPDRLKWMVQAELVHCRWAMLGAAGIFIPELLTKLGFLNTPSWYKAGDETYFADQGTLFIVELLLFAWAENRRWADIARPGSVNSDPIFTQYSVTGTDVGYPGGLWFDPLGKGKGDAAQLKELRTKEVKNGRLAMLAVLGAFVQANVTHTGPIDNLFAHIADPYHTTVVQSLLGK